MGLFSFLSRGDAAVATEPEVHQEAAVNGGSASYLVIAPVPGKLRELASVDDGVFSSGMLGQGVAIEPAGNVCVAPVTGTVMATMESNHAMAFVSAHGVEVLVHIGIDTVEMQGSGFSRLVEQGEQVQAGQPVLTFDTAAIEAAGFPATTMCVVSNSSEYRAVRPLAAGEVGLGDALLQVEG
jgi:PTS system beta-glucosides-specific IIC component